jgi:hypothetical protein
VKGVNTATHKEYIVLSAKILNPESVVMFKGREVEIREDDAGVPLARAAIDAARIQAGMQEELEELAQARNAAAAGEANVPAMAEAEDLSEDEQRRRDAEYFNQQPGMHMDVE